jgi:hypothetical protein
LAKADYIAGTRPIAKCIIGNSTSSAVAGNSATSPLPGRRVMREVHKRKAQTRTRAHYVGLPGNPGRSDNTDQLRLLPAVVDACGATFGVSRPRTKAAAAGLVFQAPLAACNFTFGTRGYRQDLFVKGRWL